MRIRDDPRSVAKEPTVCFHDILEQDKTPFDPEEIGPFRSIDSGKE